MDNFLHILFTTCLSKNFYNIVDMLHHVVQKDVFVLSFHTNKIQFESNLAWGKKLKHRNISEILKSMQWKCSSGKKKSKQIFQRNNMVNAIPFLHCLNYTYQSTILPWPWSNIKQICKWIILTSIYRIVQIM